MTTHEFDKDYWEQHWREVPGSSVGEAGRPAPNPYLVRETRDLAPGTALDAGCGEGAEARWLAAQGWRVTAADVSAEALARAAVRSAGASASERVEWVEADLEVWEPGTRFDLVATHYAHPAMPQLAFYERIAGWVAPGGTLLVVGHLHQHGHDAVPGSDDEPPARASVTAADITAGLDGALWTVVTAEERSRAVTGRAAPLHDVVVRARRRA